MKFLDVNQHLSELDEHIKVLKSYGDVFEEVEARITRVINMDGAFKGEGAQGVIYNHAHMQLPTIRSIRAFLISFSETLEKMKANISEYEPASNGSVSEAFWKNQLPNAYDRYEETLEEREATINQATAEVSHILHLGKLQTGDVYNSVDSARKHADTVLEGLYDLDQAGVELMAQVRTKMEELKATIRQVLDWTMTGGVRMSGVSIMEVGGYFANNATLHEKAPEVDTSKMSVGVYDPALADNPAYMISYQACSFNDWANPELREDYELIYETENTSSASIGQEAGSAVLDFIPVVGNIKAGVEAVIGKDLITGRELEDWERALAGAAIMGGPIVKGASRGARLVNNASNVPVHTVNNRTQALNHAKDLAGVPRSQQPVSQWQVGDDITKKGADYKNYQYNANTTHHGRYYEYDTPQGKRVVVDHINDGRKHAHAGKPDPRVNQFDYDFKENRYKNIYGPNGDHHIYYE